MAWYREQATMQVVSVYMQATGWTNLYYSINSAFSPPLFSYLTIVIPETCNNCVFETFYLLMLDKIGSKL